MTKFVHLKIQAMTDADLAREVRRLEAIERATKSELATAKAALKQRRAAKDKPGSVMPTNH